MFNLSHVHPMFVHFPIALGLLGCFFEFVVLFIWKKEQNCRCGEYLLYFATLTALISLFSGLFFTGTFVGKPGTIRDLHMMFAVIATFTLCVATVFYLKYAFSADKNIRTRKIGFVFYALAALAVAVTGAMGGTLVYNYMIGL